MMANVEIVRTRSLARVAGHVEAPPTCDMVPSHLSVRRSSIHGVGVFATQDIQEGTRLAQYAGEILTADELNERYPADAHPAYVLQIGSRFVDGSRRGGNWTRWVNDSHGTAKTNNCKYNKAGWLVTMQKVKAGNELLVGYGAGFWAAAAAADDEATRKTKKALKAARKVKREERAAKRLQRLAEDKVQTEKLALARAEMEKGLRRSTRKRKSPPV